MMKRGEMQEASFAWSDMSQSLREIFLLYEAANFQVEQIAAFNRVPYEKIERQLEDYLGFFMDRMEEIMTHYFKGGKLMVPLTPSQRIIAQQSLKALSVQEQNLLEEAFAPTPSWRWDGRYPSETFEDVRNEIMDKLTTRLILLLVVGCVRLKMNRTPNRCDVILNPRKQKFIIKPMRRKIGFVEFMLLLMEPEDRIVFLLAYGKKYDTKQIATMLDASVETVEQWLHKCWNIFHDRIAAMLPLFCGIKLGRRPNSDLHREEYRFMNSLYESLSIHARELLTDTVMGNSKTKDETNFNLSFEDVEEIRAQTDEFISANTRQLIIEKLNEKKNGHTLASRMLRRQMKQYDPLVSSSQAKYSGNEEELQKEEVRFILRSATSLGRQAFWLSRSGTMDFADATIFLGLSESAVAQACRDTTLILNQRVEEYVDAIFHGDTISPGAELIGKSAIAQASESELKAYELCHINGTSFNEVGNMRGVSSEQVQSWISNARGAFHKRIAEIAMQLIDPSHEYEPQHEVVFYDVLSVRSLQGIKKNMEPEEWDSLFQDGRSMVALYEQQIKKMPPETPDTPSFEPK